MKLVPVGGENPPPRPSAQGLPLGNPAPPTRNSSLTGRTLTHVSAQGRGISLVPRGLSAGPSGESTLTQRRWGPGDPGVVPPFLPAPWVLSTHSRAPSIPATSPCPPGLCGLFPPTNIFIPMMTCAAPARGLFCVCDRGCGVVPDTCPPCAVSLQGSPQAGEMSWAVAGTDILGTLLF